MMNNIESLSGAVTKITKSYIRATSKGRFVKTELVVVAVQNMDGIKQELDMYRTVIHNAIVRVVKAHNESVASEKDAIAKGKTLGGLFPQLEALK